MMTKPMIINDKTSDDDDEQLGGDMKISRRVARTQLAIVANFAPDVSAVEGVVMMMIRNECLPQRLELLQPILFR